jgi:hypothetical protein
MKCFSAPMQLTTDRVDDVGLCIGAYKDTTAWLKNVSFNVFNSNA